MAIYQMEIEDTVMERIATAFCVTYGYVPPAEGEAGETPNEFTKRMVANMIRSKVKDYEAERDAQQARNEAIERAESEIIIS